MEYNGVEPCRLTVNVARELVVVWMVRLLAEWCWCGAMLSGSW